ncbi:MAG: cupin domain-containing protein [Anaerolineales bacterium]|nr:cupin domain-containing protein [Anaerolineales bacterium]
MPIYKLEEIEAKEVIPGYQARFLHSDNMTLAFWQIRSGAAMPEHSHPHEQFSNVLEGEFELTLNGQAHQLRPGMVVAIPPNATHSGLAVSDCRLLDIFHPVREDFRSS